TGQRLGETWQEFFKRREESENRMLQTETDDCRRSRLQRVKNADRYMPPATSSSAAHTFEWSISAKPYLTRNYVPRSEVEDTWQHYSTGQMRYSSFANEWDLCIEFAPEEEPDDEELGQ
ncbi:hypothetical protein C8J56DRAFT_745773, partial [Mycena floridula]